MELLQGFFEIEVPSVAEFEKLGVVERVVDAMLEQMLSECFDELDLGLGVGNIVEDSPNLLSFYYLVDVGCWMGNRVYSWRRREIREVH